MTGRVSGALASMISNVEKITRALFNYFRTDRGRAEQCLDDVFNIIVATDDPEHEMTSRELAVMDRLLEHYARTEKSDLAQDITFLPGDRRHRQVRPRALADNLPACRHFKLIVFVLSALRRNGGYACDAELAPGYSGHEVCHAVAN
jgi:hypothetical protein